MPLTKLLSWLAFACLLSGFGSAARVPGKVWEAWVAHYNGPVGNGFDEAFEIVVDGAGNVYVAGRSEGVGSSYDYATLKYDSDGNLLWEARYDGGNGLDFPFGLAVDSLGNVYVTGRSEGDGTGADYGTLKYDPEGNLLWEQRYNGPGNGGDVAYALAVDSEGNVYVTGESRGDGTSRDYATLKYSSEGELLWEQRYNGPRNGVDIATAIVLDEAGNIYVTGSSACVAARADFTTLKYDPEGNVLWESCYNGPGNQDDRPTALAVDEAGNVYVAGSTQSFGLFFDYATVKIDSDGSLLWGRVYRGPGGSETNVATAVAVDGAGNVYVTGVSDGGPTRVNFDYATVKYGADGDPLWVARYEGPAGGYDAARGLVLDSAGNVYVTGESEGGTTFSDYATLKYSPDGKVLWEERYNGPGNGPDGGEAITLDPDGNVYLTGSSWGQGTRTDFTTLKYMWK